MKIAHISDIHCNYGTDFNEKIFEKAAKMVNKVNPDLVFISGDLTTEGLLSEYELAKEKIKEINVNLAVVPGNHDERNLGFKLFPEFFKETDFVRSFKDVTLIGLASSEPDKDDGRLGKGRYKKIEECIKPNKLTIVGFHHHLVPVPGSGKETNIIEQLKYTKPYWLMQVLFLVIVHELILVIHLIL